MNASSFQPWEVPPEARLVHIPVLLSIGDSAWTVGLLQMPTAVQEGLRRDGVSCEIPLSDSSTHEKLETHFHWQEWLSRTQEVEE